MINQDSIESLLLYCAVAVGIMIFAWLFFSENFVLFLKMIWPAIKDAWFRFWRWFV